MKHARSLVAALAAMAVLAGCADRASTPVAPVPPQDRPAAVTSPGTLQWFGYADGASDDPSLNGTDSYANFGQFITTETAGSDSATLTINRLAAHNMKTIVELGQLLWAPPAYTSLRSDYKARWKAFKDANTAALAGGNVLGFLIGDEPYLRGVHMAQWQEAAAMVKADYPAAKILLIEAAAAVACTSPGCSWNANADSVTTVDWVGVDRYAIHPASDDTFQVAVQKLKARFPGKPTMYFADGWWEGGAHAAGVGPVENMGSVMQEWYAVAAADPAAVLLGVYVWNSVPGWITSREFIPFVLRDHVETGRAITHRSRSRLYAPTGWLEGIDSNGVATGWACDPDGAWGETVLVDIYADGQFYGTGTYAADQSSAPIAQCRSGVYHRFRATLGIGSIGKQVTVSARDLDGGPPTTIPSACEGSPACVWYRNNYLPIGQFTLSSTGLLQGWTCDPDGPAASIKARVTAAGAVVGTYPANLASESAINTRCGGGTAHRFSTQLPASTQGKYIGVEGLDTMAGSYWLAAVPASNCPAVGYCVW